MLTGKFIVVRFAFYLNLRHSFLKMVLNSSSKKCQGVLFTPHSYCSFQTKIFSAFRITCAIKFSTLMYFEIFIARLNKIFLKVETDVNSRISPVIIRFRHSLTKENKYEFVSPTRKK